jgi:hypothetical protein
MQNKKFKNVHPVASQKLVDEFNPNQINPANLSLGTFQGSSKGKKLLPKTSPKTMLFPSERMENSFSPRSNRFVTYSLNGKAQRSKMFLDQNQDTGHRDTLLN